MRITDSIPFSPSPENRAAGIPATFRSSGPKSWRRDDHLRWQPSRTCRAVALAIVVLGLGATLAAAATRAVHETALDVLSQADFQTELPVRRAPAPPRTGADGRAPRRDSAPTESWPRRSDEQAEPRPEGADSTDAEEPQGAGRVGTLLLWTLAFAGGALLVIYLVNALPHLARRSRAEPDQKSKPGSHGEEAPMGRPQGESPLDEADRLARQGNFGEAVHLLLFRTLENLRRRLDAAQWLSLTNREIVRRVPLKEGAKSALALIVNMAELSHFGGRALDEAQYRTCRESYRRLAETSGGAS